MLENTRMSDATKTSDDGMRIDTPRPHALHPKDAKGTSQDLCAESLCAGHVIAEAVCARTLSRFATLEAAMIRHAERALTLKLLE